MGSTSLTSLGSKIMRDSQVWHILVSTCHWKRAKQNRPSSFVKSVTQRLWVVPTNNQHRWLMVSPNVSCQLRNLQLTWEGGNLHHPMRGNTTVKRIICMLYSSCCLLYFYCSKVLIKWSGLQFPVIYSFWGCYSTYWIGTHKFMDLIDHVNPCDCWPWSLDHWKHSHPPMVNGSIQDCLWGNGWFYIMLHSSNSIQFYPMIFKRHLSFPMFHGFSGKCNIIRSNSGMGPDGTWKIGGRTLPPKKILNRFHE